MSSDISSPSKIWALSSLHPYYVALIGDILVKIMRNSPASAGSGAITGSAEFLWAIQRRTTPQRPDI
jgi:hypothetical protein